MLNIINSRLLSVICTRVDVRKKHVLIGCKHNMFSVKCDSRHFPVVVVQ